MEKRKSTADMARAAAVTAGVCALWKRHPLLDNDGRPIAETDEEQSARLVSLVELIYDDASQPVGLSGFGDSQVDEGEGEPDDDADGD